MAPSGQRKPAPLVNYTGIRTSCQADLNCLGEYHGAIAETREARTSMNTILKTAVALTSVFILLGHAEAASEEPAESTTSAAPGVVDKVGNAVARGAKAAASGVERGVKAAAGGVERGAKAAASGIERGAKATARGVEHGAKATASAASRVAGKVGGSPASSPASSPTTDK
ncbi:hypothetical protein Bpro_1398 [Polaromonas sp. JS666]|nr:hypothetical protein Bpro_1398 [Polaromonas sp. JS666]